MSFTLIDTHCHPQFPQYDGDRDEIIRDALDSGIGLICVGTDLPSSKSAIVLAEAYEGVFATVGLHPNEALDESYDELAFEALLSHPKVVAVGEIGLDYYRTKDPAQQEVQRQRFALQLEMASRHGLPVIIHCREAHDDLTKLLLADKPSYQGSTSASSPTEGVQAGGVLHSFTGTWEQAQKYIGMGYCIGLNGIITFARDYDETIQRIPLGRILLETDSPYLAPVPYRGKRNVPAYIKEVAAKVSELKGLGNQEVEKVTTENAFRVFRKVYVPGLLRL